MLSDGLSLEQTFGRKPARVGYSRNVGITTKFLARARVCFVPLQGQSKLSATPRRPLTRRCVLIHRSAQLLLTLIFIASTHATEEIPRRNSLYFQNVCNCGCGSLFAEIHQLVACQSVRHGFIFGNTEHVYFIQGVSVSGCSINEEELIPHEEIKNKIFFFFV